MAIYDGFFDAVQDENTGKYDREYSAGGFTQYFAQIIGSGVCIHNNPDSFKVRLEGGKAVVSPGYLFIQGYWCKNDADYTVDLPGTGNYAIVARLNLGKRMIELETRSVAQAYPDSLVLAIVSPASAEDTRHNTDICGVINSAGELSSKVEWAVNYIDNEIESKLAAVERDINEQSEKLDRKIAEVQAVVNRIVPPPVGTIKFSASQDVGEEWLRCDGSFINEKDYPELVAALGKLIPSGDKFELLSDGEIGSQISNGVVYDGRMWVYSYSAKKLYGVGLSGGNTKEISVSSKSEYFGNFIAPNNTNPLVLSIVPHSKGSGAKLFLAQAVKSGIVNTNEAITEAFLAQHFLVFQTEFVGSESALTLDMAFQTALKEQNMILFFTPPTVVPTITSKEWNGIDRYYCAVGVSDSSIGQSFVYFVYWNDGETAATQSFLKLSDSTNTFTSQRVAFSKKSHDELVAIRRSGGGYNVQSAPNGSFAAGGTWDMATGDVRSAPLPLNITGANKVMTAFNLSLFPYASLLSRSSGTTRDPLHLPSAARIFPDAGAYLWGKDIFMVFVGTGIIFSRTLEEGSFGYLDTTSVLGTITQFGYLDYSEDEGTLYLLGQDTTNRVKVAKIVLNTLFDYANDGAWLPMIASDGVPAYIKAKETSGGGSTGGTTPMTVTVLASSGYFDSYASVLFNGEALIAGTYTRYVDPDGTFTVGFRAKETIGIPISVNMNGAGIAYASSSYEGDEKVASFKVSDFIANGIKLQGVGK